MLDLWEELRGWIPRDVDSPDWAEGLDKDELQSLMSMAIVRWGQVREVVRRSPGTSPDDLSDLVDALLDLANQFCGLLIGAYLMLPVGSDGMVTRGTKRRSIDRADLLQTLMDLQNRFELEVERATIRKAAAEVEGIRDDTRAAAGEIATADLAQHFETYRKSERTQAEVLRAIAGLLIAGAVVALAHLVPGERTTAEVLQRAVFSLPIFALAAYLSKESAQHRKASQWAATLRVQLLTIDLYAAPLGIEEAAEVRQILARRAFGDVPMLAAGDEAKEDPALPLGLQAVLERLLVELRSKPEK